MPMHQDPLLVHTIDGIYQPHDWTHDDVIKWIHFLRYWPFAQGIHRSPVNSPHKGQWRAALMFSLISAWINGWVNNREASDIRRPLGHYDVCVKPRSHCADHSLPMFPIIADRPDLSWSWQNHQIVALAPDLCLSKTASTILVRQLYDTGTTEVFDPLLVRFPRPLVRPLIRSTRLRARCWRPHPRSCRFATTIKTT